MSSHRAGRRAVESRAAGDRRVAGATALSAVSGTALAVLFGTLFAQSTATPVVAAADARPVEAAAAITVAGANGGRPANSVPTSAAPKPATPGTHAPAGTHESGLQAPAPRTSAPQPPAAAPQTAAGTPEASSGGS